MFDHKHYVPILKGKRGEFWALAHSSATAKSGLTPLIEVVPRSSRKTEQQHLDQTANSLFRAWGGASRVFVDMLWRQNEPRIGGRHVLEYFFGRARQAGLLAVPVTSLTRDPQYQQAVQAVVHRDARGIGLRLSVDDTNDSRALARAIDALLNLLSIRRQDADLIIDFGSVVGVPIPTLTAGIVAAIAAIPNLAQWRSFTIAGGSFPPNLNNLQQHAWNSLDRRMWIAWRSVVTGRSRPSRRPAFGDYCVGDPQLPYSGFAYFSASLRYAADDVFFVWRGSSTAHHPQGNGQMYAVCADLIARPQYAGQNFSRGDAEIFATATNQGSPGAPQQWRQWATSHYLEMVPHQIANCPGL